MNRVRERVTLPDPKTWELGEAPTHKCDYATCNDYIGAGVRSYNSVQGCVTRCRAVSEKSKFSKTSIRMQYGTR